MWLSLLLSLSAGVLLWLGGFFADSKGRRRLLAVVLPVIGFTLTLAHEYLDAAADNVAATRAAESDAALNREITDMSRQLAARADSDAALNREITVTTRQLAERTRLAAESDAALNHEITQLLTANGELNKELSERAKVSAESDAALNREIANLATQNAALNRELADYARGGDSYYYIHLKQVGTELQDAKITHIGEHPVWNSSVEVYDVSDQADSQKWSLGAKAPIFTASLPGVFHHGSRKLLHFPQIKDDTRTAIVYFIVIYAQNGEIRQRLRLNKADDKWLQRYTVSRVDDASGREVPVVSFP